jgi:hypothetical protein
MQRFSPGDRVVAINTKLDGPIRLIGDPKERTFRFPDGPLRRGVVYRVDEVASRPDAQGLFLNGIRVIENDYEIPWDSSRFRKVEEVGHPAIAKKAHCGRKDENPRSNHAPQVNRSAMNPSPNSSQTIASSVGKNGPRVSRKDGRYSDSPASMGGQ